MVAPNIVSAVSVIGKTKLLPLVTTNSVVVSNSANSNKLYKVSTIMIANTGTEAAAATVYVTSVEEDDMFILVKIAHEIVVPPNATLAVINRNTPIYVEENFSIGASASADGALELICAYEEIM